MLMTATYFLLGCSTAAATHSLGEPVSLDAGTMAKFADEFRVTFTRVVSDSRCPANVVCIQAGEAVVELTCSNNGDSQSVRLSSDHRSNQSEVLGHAIELMSVGARHSDSITLRVTAR